MREEKKKDHWTAIAAIAQLISAVAAVVGVILTILIITIDGYSIGDLLPGNFNRQEPATSLGRLDTSQGRSPKNGDSDLNSQEATPEIPQNESMNPYGMTVPVPTETNEQLNFNSSPTRPPEGKEKEQVGASGERPGQSEFDSYHHSGYQTESAMKRELARLSELTSNTDLRHEVASVLAGQSVHVVYSSDRIRDAAQLVHRLVVLEAEVTYEFAPSNKEGSRKKVAYRWDQLEVAQAIQSVAADLEPLRLRREDALNTVRVWIL